MALLLALLLVVHGGVHISYVCGPAWPFVATDPWLVSSLGAGSDSVRTVGIALAVVTFIAFLLAALTVAGIVLPSRFWAPLVVVGSMASAIVLVIFVTPWTLPFLAIDALLLWATLVQGWHPTPFFGS
jgi:hypothetical protein